MGKDNNNGKEDDSEAVILLDWTDTQKNNWEQVYSDGIFCFFFCAVWFCFGAALADGQMHK